MGAELFHEDGQTDRRGEDEKSLFNILQTHQKKTGLAKVYIGQI